jgi:hypothetical protein
VDLTSSILNTKKRVLYKNLIGLNLCFFFLYFIIYIYVQIDKSFSSIVRQY